MTKKDTKQNYLLMFQMFHSNGHSIVDLLGGEFLLSAFIAENIRLKITTLQAILKNGKV